MLNKGIKTDISTSRPKITGAKSYTVAEVKAMMMRHTNRYGRRFSGLIDKYSTKSNGK